MSVERMDDGTLRLSVPHPDDALPHDGLVPLASSGYYKIVPYGGTEWTAHKTKVDRLRELARIVRDDVDPAARELAELASSLI
jgi:hypothetical protein